jgi:hypothetical protein
MKDFPSFGRIFLPMKLLAIATLLTLGASSLAGPPNIPPNLLPADKVPVPSGPGASAETPNPGPPPLPVETVRDPAPWSAAGKWEATETDNWTDTITICPDGSFSRTQGDAGRWTLTGLGDHIALVLAWDKWPAETVTMITPSEFRGKGLEIHRVEPLAAKPPRAAKHRIGSVETETWRQGEPPLRLIREDEGFCALSLVTGHFQGGGELVKVYVGDDGYWYLGGHSRQQGVAAQCIVVRYGK